VGREQIFVVRNKEVWLSTTLELIQVNHTKQQYLARLPFRLRLDTMT